MAIFNIFKRSKNRGLRFIAAAVSDQGLQRSNNEDNYVLGESTNADFSPHSEAFLKDSSSKYVAAVFDGMGGIDRGELASSKAAETLLNTLKKAAPASGQEELDNTVRAFFCDANRNVVTLQEQGGLCGTTAVLMCATREHFKIFHMGDSRAYLFRDGGLFRLTEDHTLARMKLEMGLYDESDPLAQEEKHKLTEFLGRYKGDAVRPDESKWTKLQKGDRLLLCSDGLYDMCPDTRIGEILASALTPEDAAQKLVSDALERGGEDNVTCLVVQFT